MKLRIILMCLTILASVINYALKFKKTVKEKSTADLELCYASAHGKLFLYLKVKKMTK